jgi:hypothetical protein
VPTELGRPLQGGDQQQRQVPKLAGQAEQKALPPLLRGWGSVQAIQDAHHRLPTDNQLWAGGYAQHRPDRVGPLRAGQRLLVLGVPAEQGPGRAAGPGQLAQQLGHRRSPRQSQRPAQLKHLDSKIDPGLQRRDQPGRIRRRPRLPVAVLGEPAGDQDRAGRVRCEPGSQRAGKAGATAGRAARD